MRIKNIILLFFAVVLCSFILVSCGEEPSIDVMFDDDVFSDFSLSNAEYKITLDEGQDYPTVSIVSRGHSLSGSWIVPASDENDGVCSFNVPDSDGNERIYKIMFTKPLHTAEKAKILPAKNGAQSIVTITHDDGTQDTGRFLSEQFEKNDLCGTVCMIVKDRIIKSDGTKNTSSISFWQSLIDTGRFDIACHSWTHTFFGIHDSGDKGVVLYSNTNKNGPSVGTVDTPAGNLTHELVDSQKVLRSVFPDQRVLVFVKPGTNGYKDENGVFTQLSPEGLDIVKEHYIGIRNTTGGLSGMALVGNIPTVNSYEVHSLQVSPSHTAEQWMDYVDKAVEKHGWMIFLFHQIVDDEKASGINVGKSKVADLLEYVSMMKKDNKVWCAFLEEAMQYTVEYGRASGTVETFNDHIEVSLTDDLDDSLYDCPLTVKVPVSAAWNKVLIIHEDGTGEELETFTENGQKYVYANVIPDRGVSRLLPIK